MDQPSIDNDQQHSIALDQYNGSTCLEISQSDTLPSISFDENLQQPAKEFFLKDLHDKISNLREENFDLKMKLYLLENNDNLINGNSELKQKVVKEFDRKNGEIKNLKSTLSDKETEIKKLQILREEKSNDNKFRHENKKLKMKLLELFNAYSDLYKHLRAADKSDFDSKLIQKLDSSSKIIEKTKNFLIENGINPNKMIELNNNDGKCSFVNQSTQTILDNLIYSKTNNVQTTKCCTTENLREIINDFRNNKLNYKTFLERLDQIIVQQQDQPIQNDDLEFKHKLYSSLLIQLDNLDQLNLKISSKQQN